MEDDVVTISSADLMDAAVKAGNAIRASGIPSLCPALWMLRIKGKPYTLKNHFMFEPMFRLDLPRRTLFKSSRQVGKSQNLCGSRLLKSVTMPYYNILFVSPRFEQVKRLSNQVMRPLIEDAVAKPVFLDDISEQSILERSFATRSIQHYSFAFMDCERIRGISTQENVIDESCTDSEVKTYNLDCSTATIIKKLSEIKPGDLVESFNSGGEIVPSIVEKAWCAGERECFRISLEDGSYIEGTIDHHIPTSRGYMRVEEVIEHVYGTERDDRGSVRGGSDTVDLGNITRGRLCGYSEEIQGKPHHEAEGICLGEVSNVVRVQSKRTVDDREWWLRGLLGVVEHISPSDLCLFTSDTAPEQPSDGYTDAVDRTHADDVWTAGGQYGHLKPSRIVKIEHIGVHKVYDLTVAGTNAFVANNVAVHNCQDINWDFLPVISETLSGSERWRNQLYTGTPKTFENTIEKLWQESSMAEWGTKCSCGNWNIAGLGQDLIKMIGKKTCICAKCGKKIYPETGMWIHSNPDMRPTFAGYHVCQIVHPYQYNNPANWAELLYKMRVYPIAKFYNECLGETWDSSSRLMTMTALVAIASEYHNSLTAALSRMKYYSHITMGIDWGGGGDASGSFTAIVIAGLRSGTDVIEVIYARKTPTYTTPADETKIILELIKLFNPILVAHDYGGAGAIRETLLLQTGYPLAKIVPYTYVFAPTQQVIRYVKAEKGYRSSYNIDKPRSLRVLCAMMKAGKIRLPSWDTSRYCPVTGETLFEDFLNILEDRHERDKGPDILLVTKVAAKSDDTVHALNYAASCIWYMQQRYPDISEAMEISIMQEELNKISPTTPEWQGE